MTETKKRPKKFILRRLIVVAVVLALAFALAMGANAATGGELFERVITFTTFSDDGTCYGISIDRAAVEHAGEEGVLFTFTEGEGSKAVMAFGDSEGHFFLEDVDLSSDPQEIVENIRAIIEAEKSAASESEAADK